MLPAIRKLLEDRLNTLGNEIGYERYSESENEAMREERDEIQSMLDLDLGATGEFPDGKLNSNDQGGLNIQIGRNEVGNVVVNFGKSVAWLAMPPPDAANFALTILGHAGAKITVSVDDAMIQRANDFLSRANQRIIEPPWIPALLKFALNGETTE